MAERYFPDRSRQLLTQTPEAWGGRAAVAWVRQLALDRSFDPAVKHLPLVAAPLDRLYGRLP